MIKVSQFDNTNITSEILCVNTDFGHLSIVVRTNIVEGDSVYVVWFDGKEVSEFYVFKEALDLFNEIQAESL